MTVVLVLMKICGITLSTSRFALLLYFYFSIYIKLLKRKKPLETYNDIKYMLEILAMHCQEIEKQVENYFLKFVLSVNT